MTPGCLDQVAITPLNETKNGYEVTSNFDYYAT